MQTHRLIRGFRLNLDTRIYRVMRKKRSCIAIVSNLLLENVSKLSSILARRFSPYSTLNIDTSISYRDIENQKAFTIQELLRTGINISTAL